MDALMICLLAAAVSTIGSRWWLLAGEALSRLPGWPGWTAVIASALIAATAAATFGAGIAAQMRGPGMLLLLALALLFAAVAMAWPVRPLAQRLRESLSGPFSAVVLLLAAMMSDSVPFIILAATAWTGAPVLAAAGGAAGLGTAAYIAAMGGGAEPPRWLRPLRLGAAVLLAMVAALSAISALGIG